NPDAQKKRVATFKLDPSQQPKVIWLTPADEKAPPVRGIYGFDEGRLKLCFDNDEGKAVPTDFATKPGSGLTLIVLAPAPDLGKVAEDERPSQLLRTFTGSGAPVRGVAVSPDGRIVAACAEDGRVHGWDTATGKLWYRIGDDSLSCRSLAFSADAKLLAVAASRTLKQTVIGSVHVAQANTGKLILDITEDDGGTTAVAISPDGRHLVSAGG